jgi:hypothetical protein
MPISKPANPIKSNKSKTKFAHESSNKFGMGDNYGTGIKNKIGKVRDNYDGMNNLSKKKLGTPPKSVV